MQILLQNRFEMGEPANEFGRRFTIRDCNDNSEGSDPMDSCRCTIEGKIRGSDRARTESPDQCETDQVDGSKSGKTCLANVRVLIGQSLGRHEQIPTHGPAYSPAPLSLVAVVLFVLSAFLLQPVSYQTGKTEHGRPRGFH